MSSRVTRSPLEERRPSPRNDPFTPTSSVVAIAHISPNSRRRHGGGTSPDQSKKKKWLPSINTQSRTRKDGLKYGFTFQPPSYLKQVDNEADNTPTTPRAPRTAPSKNRRPVQRMNHNHTSSSTTDDPSIESLDLGAAAARSAPVKPTKQPLVSTTPSKATKTPKVPTVRKQSESSSIRGYTEGSLARIPPPADEHIDRIAIHNRHFQNYHQILTATKAEREAMKLEQRADTLVRRGIEDEGLTMMERVIWIRSNFAALHGGHLPGAGAKGAVNELACLPGGITGSYSTEAIANPYGTMWEQAETVVVIANQITVRCIRTLGNNYATLTTDMMNLCQRLLWTPVVMLARDPDMLGQPAPSAAPGVLAAGPIVGSDPFAGFPALRRYLLGASLNNYGAYQLLQKVPIVDVITTFERCLRLEEGNMSCRTLFNLGAVLVQAGEFDYAMESASRCIELANHYLSLPFIKKEQDTLQHRVFLAETAVSATLAHHLISAVALWCDMEYVAIHQAQLAMGCSQVYLGATHALTTRCAERLDSLLKGDLNGETGDFEAPPTIPLQMATFATGVRPSSIVPYAVAYPLSQTLQDFFDVVTGRESISKKLKASAAAAAASHSPMRKSRKPPISIKIAARTAMSQYRNAHVGGPSSPARGGGPTISAATVARAPTASYLDQIRKAAAKRAPVPETLKLDTLFQTVLIPMGPLFDLPEVPVETTQQQQQQTSPRGRSGVAPIAPHPPGSSALLAPPRRPSAFMVEEGSPSPPRRSSFIPPNAAPSPPHTAPTGGGRRRSSLGVNERRGLRTPPRIGDHDAPPAVSIIPLRDFELYTTLKNDVNTYLATQPVAATDGLVPAFNGARSGRQLAPISKGIIASTGKVEKQAFNWMTTADDELKRMSTVLPDHTSEHEALWHAASRVLQGFRRVILAKRYLYQKQQDALEQEGRRLAAESIVSFFRNIMGCIPAKVARRALRAHRAEQKRHALVQAFARCHESACEVGKRLVIQFEAALIEKKHNRMQNLASVLIQSAFRGFRTRGVISDKLTATKKLQRFWRLFLAYREVRILVFHQRSTRREEALFVNNSATRLQRWSIHMLLRIRAERELSERKQRLQTHMDEYRRKDIEYWNLFRNVDEEECVHLICRVGRGSIVRRKASKESYDFKRFTVAAKKIQHWVRFMIASRILEKRRQAKQGTFDTKRRVEDRKVAAIDIQSVARMFLQRRKFGAMLQHESVRRVAAAKIQSYFRRASNRKVFRELQDQAAWNRLLYLRAETRKDAATRIQSLFRQVKAKEVVKDVRLFKNTLQPQFAIRIQRAVRRFLARRAQSNRLTYQEIARRPAMLKEVQEAGAIKIQSMWRMHLVATDPTIGREAHPTYVASKAAKRIQTIWRSAAAKNLVCQMRIQQAFCDQSAMDQEHLHVYASKIQSMVRSRIFARRLVNEARERIHLKAVWVIQRLCTRYMNYKTEHKQASDNAFKAWEALQTLRQEEAAIEIQSLLQEKAAKQAFAAKVKAGIQIVRWSNVMLAQKKLRQLKQDQQGVINAQVHKEQNEAATDIQRAWRSRRQT